MRNPLYFVKRALRNITETPFLNLVTIGTVAIAMLLFGSFLLMMVNLRGVVVRMAGNVEVSAFLYDDALVADALQLRGEIEELALVESATYISREDALDEFRERNPEDAARIDQLGENPLPASILVRLAEGHRDARSAREVAARMHGNPAVEDVSYGQDWIEKFSSALALLKAVGLGLAGLLVLAIITIVSNTIKLSVYARKDELEIMRLVGATNFFIRAPYLIEGTLQGTLGAAVAVISLWALFVAFGAQASTQLVPLLGIEQIAFLPSAYILGMLGGGLVMGLFGSVFSVGRFLRA